MRNSLLILAAATGLLAAAGPAAGQAPGMKTIEAPPLGGADQRGRDGTEVPSNLGAFDAGMVGRTLYNRAGEVIGTVKSVEHGRMIVAIDSELGIGARDIGLNRAQVAQAGGGREPRLVTDLSRAELAALPAVGQEMRPAPARP